MKYSIIDFNKISQALSGTLEAMKVDGEISSEALEQLEHAQLELQQAMSHSLSLHK